MLQQHSQIDQAILGSSGTIFVPTAQLAESKTKIAPSKLVPGIHFVIENHDACIEETKQNLIKFLHHSKLDERNLPSLMEMEAKILQRKLNLKNALGNEISVRYAIVDPLFDCLVATFNLSVSIILVCTILLNAFIFNTNKKTCTFYTMC